MLIPSELLSEFSPCQRILEHALTFLKPCYNHLMKTSKTSFKGTIELRMLDIASGINKVQKIRTKKADDELLLKLAKELNSEPYSWARKYLDSNKTKELDTVFERILKRKLPDETYIRSMSSPTYTFLYLIAHPDTFGPKPLPTLINGGMAIDFFA